MCESIGSSAFLSCSSICSADFPECTIIGGSAFYSCINLSEINIPKCTTIGSYAFRGCIGFSELNFSKCETIYEGAFYYCPNVTAASFHKCSEIYTHTFYGCSNLVSVYLMGSHYVTLSNTYAFYATPLYTSSYIGSFGSIYVPSSMVSTYITMLNWSYYSSRFVGV